MPRTRGVIANERIAYRRCACSPCATAVADAASISCYKCTLSVLDINHIQSVHVIDGLVCRLTFSFGSAVRAAANRRHTTCGLGSI